MIMIRIYLKIFLVKSLTVDYQMSKKMECVTFVLAGGYSNSYFPNFSCVKLVRKIPCVKSVVKFNLKHPEAGFTPPEGGDSKFWALPPGMVVIHESKKFKNCARQIALRNF